MTLQLPPPALNGVPYPALFVRAVLRVLGNEGGYVNLTADPGGATAFGISQRDYPDLDIGKLTRDGAIAIYFKDFWETGRYAELPESIAIKLFDLSINMGPSNATRCLQRALRGCASPTVEDGRLGDETIIAATRAYAPSLLAALRSEAAGYYRAAAEPAGKGADGKSEFLQGWLRRAYQ
ncbi:MAG TPA: glycosyl hydrolase 108 family protein [Candidatus Binataceae bacterium]|nr:glycosyl hydrolase 108 family protein [Candidatus Binataceae bacterium]